MPDHFNNHYSKQGEPFNGTILISKTFSLQHCAWMCFLRRLITLNSFMQSYIWITRLFIINKIINIFRYSLSAPVWLFDLVSMKQKG